MYDIVIKKTPDSVSISPCLECFNCSMSSECDYIQWVLINGSPMLPFIFNYSIRYFNSSSCYQACQYDSRCYSFTSTTVG